MLRQAEPGGDHRSSADGARRAAVQMPKFLGALHAVPVAWMDGLVEVDDEPPAAWLEEAVQTYPAVKGTRQRTCLGGARCCESLVTTLCGDERRWLGQLIHCGGLGGGSISSRECLST